MSRKCPLRKRGFSCGFCEISKNTFWNNWNHWLHIFLHCNDWSTCLRKITLSSLKKCWKKNSRQLKYTKGHHQFISINWHYQTVHPPPLTLMHPYSPLPTPTYPHPPPPTQIMSHPPKLTLTQNNASLIVTYTNYDPINHIYSNFSLITR